MRCSKRTLRLLEDLVLMKHFTAHDISIVDVVDGDVSVIKDLLT